MRGNTNIINSKDDASVANLDKDKIIEMATISVRHDDAKYPDDYDKSLKQGDDGYIEPDYRFENEIDQAILSRFGITI